MIWKRRQQRHTDQHGKDVAGVDWAEGTGRLQNLATMARAAAIIMATK